jgi:hypothetical protein
MCSILAQYYAAIRGYTAGARCDYFGHGANSLTGELADWRRDMVFGEQSSAHPQMTNSPDIGGARKI